jgi:hypothetical protein
MLLISSMSFADLNSWTCHDHRHKHTHTNTSEQEGVAGRDGRGMNTKNGVFIAQNWWERLYEDLDFHCSKLGREKDISTYQLLRRWLSLTIIMTIITQWFSQDVCHLT